MSDAPIMDTAGASVAYVYERDDGTFEKRKAVLEEVGFDVSDDAAIRGWAATDNVNAMIFRNTSRNTAAVVLSSGMDRRGEDGIGEDRSGLG